MLKKAENQKRNCPKCAVEMIRGSLKDAGERIYITSYQSMDPCVLWAMICPQCGHVELIAVDPKKLARQDINLDEIEDLFSN